MSQYVRDPVTGQIRLKTPQEVMTPQRQTIDPVTEGLAISIEQTSPELADLIRRNAGANASATTSTESSAPKSADDYPQRKSDPIPTQTNTRTDQPQATTKLQTDNQGNIQQLVDLLRPLLDPKTVNDLEDKRLGRELQLADRYGQLARERDIEMQNIRSWQAIQQAQINRDAILAQSLATTSYLAMTPNANTLNALNQSNQAAINAFRR